ncbi:MAG TPA: hypothetical protein DD001_20970 [Microcoleaceae bacterium UBA10368]|nr:hypothetical protein [Microcoleaceae cyanobacterium UBA10368]HCV30552.1 hypothetical protein [Microcoleaceae cyanobacterium UBA9251]
MGEWALGLIVLGIGDWNKQITNPNPLRACLKARIHNASIFILTNNFKGGTSPRIYSFEDSGRNQSKIPNLKSSSPRIYPWGKSKI